MRLSIRMYNEVEPKENRKTNCTERAEPDSKFSFGKLSLC